MNVRHCIMQLGAKTLWYMEVLMEVEKIQYRDEAEVWHWVWAFDNFHCRMCAECCALPLTWKKNSSSRNLLIARPYHVPTSKRNMVILTDAQLPWHLFFLVLSFRKEPNHLKSTVIICRVGLSVPASKARWIKKQANKNEEVGRSWLELKEISGDFCPLWKEGSYNCC